MSKTTLNLTPALYSYYSAHAYREISVLTELRAYTLEKFGDGSIMQIAPEQGQFMQLFLKAIQAKTVLEIGTFTGYSALCMALALPQDGKVVTCDVDPIATEIAQQYWQKAQMANKITLKLGSAEETLKMLVETKDLPPFDFAFIDADKINYDSYYEYCLQLIRSGGVIALDNTLRGGAVADPNDQRPSVKAIQELNDKLIQDTRVFMSMLPIADGLTLVYKR